MDMQFTPAFIGAVLLFVLLGMTDNPAFDEQMMRLKFYALLALPIAAIAFGFAMHLYSLGYPESSFNRHSSPAFMTLLCAGPLVYGAYRFHHAGMFFALTVSSACAALICGASIGFSLFRKSARKGDSG